MRRSGTVVVGGAIAAIVVTCLAGTPAELPSTALGSAVLLHVEPMRELASDAVDEIAQLHGEVALLRRRVEAVEDAA